MCCLALSEYLAQHTDTFSAAQISAPTVLVKGTPEIAACRTFKQHDHHRAWFRLLNAVLRGATTGFCLR